MAFTKIGRIGLCTAAAAAASPAAQAQASAGASLRLSTGHVIVMAPAEAMDCPDLALKLDEIDRTGYRGRRPQPRDSSDMPMLRYENEISNHYYSRCMRLQESVRPSRNALFQAAPAEPDASAPDAADK